MTDLSKSMDLSIGSVISFGRYNNTPLQWYILDNDTINHRYLLLSVDILEKRPYYEPYNLQSWLEENNTRKYFNGPVKEYMCITYAKSTIRSWLNGYGPAENKEDYDYSLSNFISNAFTIEERARIPSVEIINDNNPKHGTPGGVNTTDKVFLLSITELNSLRLKVNDDFKFSFDSARWWLRTPGHFKWRAAYVDHMYNRDYPLCINYDGQDVCDKHTGIRPALWLNYE